MTKRTVLNFETREFLLIHKVNDEIRSLCNDCNAETDWLTTEQSVVVTGLSARELFRRVENGALHHKESPQGFLFICSQSLSNECGRSGDNFQE